MPRIHDEMDVVDGEVLGTDGAPTTDEGDHAQVVSDEEVDAVDAALQNLNVSDEDVDTENVAPKLKGSNVKKQPILSRRESFVPDASQVMKLGSEETVGANATPTTRMVINKLVLVNFKSYAYRQEIGPFHKVASTKVDRCVLPDDAVLHVDRGP